MARKREFGRVFGVRLPLGVQETVAARASEAGLPVHVVVRDLIVAGLAVSGKNGGVQSPELADNTKIGPEPPDRLADSGNEAGTPGFTTSAAKATRIGDRPGVKAAPRRTHDQAEANRAQQRRELADGAVEALGDPETEPCPAGGDHTWRNVPRGGINTPLRKCIKCNLTP